MNNLFKVLEEKLNGLISEHDFFRVIGDAIYDRRNLLGLSREALGNLVGVSRSVITNIEKGKPTNNFYVIYQLIIVLEIDVSELNNKIKRITKEPKPYVGPNEKKFHQILKTVKLSEPLYEYLILTLKYISGGKKE